VTNPGSREERVGGNSRPAHQLAAAKKCVKELERIIPNPLDS
jgi:hypothetical protein